MASIVGSHCLDAACRTLGSAHLTAVPEDGAYDDATGSYGTALHVFGGASVVSGGKIKLVADLATVEDNGERALGGYLGVRLARPRWSIDAGLVGGTAGEDSGVLPVPLGGVAGRW